MGTLAVIALRFVHNGSVTREDTAWLIRNLVAARRELSGYEDHLGNEVTDETHLVELTEFGYRVDHSSTCGGVPGCPIHYRLTTEYQDTDGFEALDDGVYLVWQAWDGSLMWEPQPWTGETNGRSD